MLKVFKSFLKWGSPTPVRLFTIFMLLFSVLSQIPVLPVKAQGTPLILTKEIEGGVTTAQVGDVIRYRIRFECSSLLEPCGELEITDVLEPGLIYLPPPQSSVPSGFSINYNSGSRTITITKDDNNLLDGSQYDAVIAVQVDYDLRPLPATINNEINGRIYPPSATGWQIAVPDSAPPIDIGVVNPYWDMEKTLVSPQINPTVDTDVTYRLQLCPGTPPPNEGNVPLEDITITDTLPAGATFISASNGGDGLTTPGTVTWPVIPGPVYPPNCVTRYVTILYDGGTFSVGESVTNTASADGVYTDPDEHIIGPVGIDTEPIIHPIDPVFEVPTYGKNDGGDPIGIDGTGRFIISLNTNATNYPSDELVLIDNLPPELEVTSVTSGEWDASFDYVRAYVEYSTDYGNSYTPFPGQPVSYDTNASYTAPVANITNVRWRFEYDSDGALPFDLATTKPGLPYTWQYTTSPQIRVTPRAVATTADDGPPATVMPAAVAGSTYNNCLQVSRINSAGTPITDPCDNETMTVEGGFVSLRPFKTEQPGTGWDDLDDPLINTFTADGSLLPGDTLRYTITVLVTERSSEPLIDPTILDTLPPDLIFVRNGTARLDGTPLAIQPVFSQPAADQLMWEFTGLSVDPLPLNDRQLTMEFFARVPRGQAPGTYTNNLYTVTDSVDAYCEIGTQVEDQANGDVDGDGDITDPACLYPDTYIVVRSAALRGEKWIRSNDALNNEVVDSTTFLPDPTCPDGGPIGLAGGGGNLFTRYPCISQAYPEGMLSPGQLVPPSSSLTLDDFEYNLRIFNDGNVDMLSYTLYDILPYVGDTGSGGTLSGDNRLSEFRPTLRGPVEFISGPGTLSAGDFTIEYNDTTNPCRPEVFNLPAGDLEPAGCDNTWTTTWSTSARSYRIRLNSGSYVPPATASAELRFGVPMYIPADAPVLGVFDADDAQSLEIAWNSFSHVGSYDSDPNPPVVVQDLLASEPRKVGITIPEVMSVGNRVWRDSDNSGTINPPDNAAPGIAGVRVNLYQDVDNNNVPDGADIAFTTTDAEGYYLFSNIPYDLGNINNNRYIIGIPDTNFNAGQPLENLRSSTGTPPSATYTNPSSSDIDDTDSSDDGIDPVASGDEVFCASFILQPSSEPEDESDLSNNSLDGLAGARRGVNGERDENSDLTIDFGFFGGTDIPFSIGNHVWYDNGAGGGIVNDGIRQVNEPPVPGVEVRLYRDGNGNDNPEVFEYIRNDITDANGFYLFDNLDPGPYFVQIPPSEFGVGQPLAGWYSSQPTGTETTGVNGGTATVDIDGDDNGVNTNFPETYGVYSGIVILTRGTNEPTGEIHLSNEPDPDADPLTPNLGVNPTEWDGPLSRGRYGETDENSNLTIDFGFIPPMSLGNRVWLDEGAGTLPFRTGYNNGLQDGTEAGVSGVRVELWRDTNGTSGIQTGTDTLLHTTTTDVDGYYLFDRLQPGDHYYVRIPPWNFSADGRPLRYYVSSFDTNQVTPPADDTEDTDDNGIDDANPAANGIFSPLIVMSYGTEPLTPADETDINNSGVYGPQNVGNFNQADANSNLTMDFGFIRPPRSLGNYLWLDENNNGQVDAGESPVPANVRVSLYLDANGDNQPDDLGVPGDRTDDWLAYDFTDANGYYLFDFLPPNTYIVGVDRENFAPGGLLEGYNSSTGYVDNASNDLDSRDNGVDRLQRWDPVVSPHGVLSTRIDLTTTPVNAPTGEAGSGNTEITAGFNPTAGDGVNSRGRYNETDENSDLTIDFGFFRPMSLGNRVFMDDGVGGGGVDDGIMNGLEVGVPNVRVELYRDDDGNGTPDTGGYVGFDVTDAGGFYLFDNLAEGSYVVLIPSGNFTTSFDPDGGGPLPTGAGALLGFKNSTPTAIENTGLAGNPYLPDTDRDDNGVNDTRPDLNGIYSGTIALQRNNEPAAENELSGQANPGSSTNTAFNPTGWDGPNSRGRWEESDNNSNLTVDFGFLEFVAIGNVVWDDSGIGSGGIANNGIQDGTEPGISDVDLQLYHVGDSPGIDTPVAITTTAANGYYVFDNLLPGNYFVHIPVAEFNGTATLAGYHSSTGNGADEITNENGDENGIDSATPWTTGINSTNYDLQPNSEQTGESQPNYVGSLDDNNVNFTADFGFYNNPMVDLGISKDDGSTFYIPGMTLNYTVMVVNNGPINVAGLNVSDTRPAQISSWSWGCTSSAPDPTPATYGCTADATNPATFTDTLDLPVGASVTYAVTATVGAAAAGDLDNTASVQPPVGYTDINVTDNTDTDTDLPAELTVTKDDGVTIVAPASILTYSILVENTGSVDLTDITITDTLPADVSYQSATIVPDHIAGGVLTWNGRSLLVGDSITIDVTVQVSDTPTGGSITNSVTATDGNTNTTSTDDDTDNVAVTNTKALIDTNVAGSTTPQVFIGEVLTYQINLTVPVGSMNGLRALDVLDGGLAFDECLVVTVSNNNPIEFNTNLPGGFSDACPAAIGDPNVTNSGHNVIFDFGNVRNNSGSEQTITVEYTVDVLDIVSNTNGVTGVNNLVTWTWDGGSLEGSALEVEIVEPDISIVKEANPATSLLGSTITFTIELEHTGISTADAYDMVVTDQLPSGLGYIGNITVTGLAYDRTNFDLATSTLTFEWDTFPLLAVSTITFDAIFIGPSPVYNEASVAWTSVPSNPGVQSDYNPDSTERFYDPLNPAGVNDYGISSRIRISVPRFPSTGYPPGLVTHLPEQPESQLYTDLGDLWLEIPELNVQVSIVGVPLSGNGWNLKWLANQAGWMEGTAYPTWAGNSGITAHVYTADGEPGPFVDLHTLSWGDKVIVHAFGQKYIYEVRSTVNVRSDRAAGLPHEDYPWLTLITCQGYNEYRDEYIYRVLVRAVQVAVEADD
ncbi:MAG: DUF11 domain-containing protein [Anaerolineales bacterium]|nr:DUF11 domain-containing protein [Anaerolineales bacterium]